LDHFGGRKSEDFAENPLPRISMFTSSRCWSDFGRISQQIRGFQFDYECGSTLLYFCITVFFFSLLQAVTILILLIFVLKGVNMKKNLVVCCWMKFEYC
jgi:hypothetical protein